MNWKSFILALLVGMFAGRKSSAQYENIWVFGENAGIDFNSGSPQFVSTSITGTNAEASASVCDANGNLLFYTEGMHVWNSEHNLMPNGSALVPGFNSTDMVTSSASQGTVIVPYPGAPDKYMVFSLTAMEFWESIKAGYIIVSLICAWMVVRAMWLADRRASSWIPCYSKK